jgi:hypothetical protein
MTGTRIMFIIYMVAIVAGLAYTITVGILGY